MMVVQRWRQWRARRQAEWHRKLELEQREAQRLEERTWGILRGIADPLVADDLARLRWVTFEPGPWMHAQPTKGGVLEPVGEGCAAVWLEPIETAYIHVVVGEPFPEGTMHELVFDDGWEDELRAYLEAIVDGRYRERIHDEGGREMIFDLPDGGERTLSGEPMGTGHMEPGEYGYARYRG